jgi:hypothetical protein
MCENACVLRCICGDGYEQSSVPFIARVCLSKARHLRQSAAIVHLVTPLLHYALETAPTTDASASFRADVLLQLLETGFLANNTPALLSIEQQLMALPRVTTCTVSLVAAALLNERQWDLTATLAQKVSFVVVIYCSTLINRRYFWVASYYKRVWMSPCVCTGDLCTSLPLRSRL